MKWTGEYVIPGQVPEGLEALHRARYRLALDRLTSAAGSPPVWVLDAPCGTGYGTALFYVEGCDVVGMDISDSAISYAQSHYVEDDGHTNPFFFCADIGAGPLNMNEIVFPDGGFDAIVCFEGIEHVEPAAGQVWLKNFAAVTRPGGWLFVSSPNPATSLSRGGEWHKHEYTPIELKYAIEDAGDWKVVQAWKQSRDPEQRIQEADPTTLVYWDTDPDVGFAILKAVRV